MFSPTPSSSRPATRALLTEKVADLPNLHWLLVPELATRAEPASGTHEWLCDLWVVQSPLEGSARRCCNCWAVILRALPNSRLVSQRSVARSAQRTGADLGALANEGIAPDRVTILDQGTRTSHFAGYHDIDIALDPFPHSGGMTTLDALWMGVPVVTCPGPTDFIFGPPAACLTAAGLTTTLLPILEITSN